jgi:hypothetical protein
MRLAERLVPMVLLTGCLVAVSATGPNVAPAGAATNTISIGDTSVPEGDSGALRSGAVSLTLSQPSSTAVTVQYTLMSETATPGVDYKALTAAKTVTFNPGVVKKFVAVSTYPDTADEGDERFHVMLSTPTGGFTIGDDEGVVTIVDDDPNGSQQVAVGDGTVVEGDDTKPRAIKFWVNLADPAASTVTVTASTMAVSATAGIDFKAVSKVVTFSAGQVKKPVIITTYADTTDEIDEELHVMLSGATGATIADDTGVGVIVDDDASAGVVTATYRIGPFNLAAEGQPGDQNESNAAITRPAGHVGITGMRFDLVDSAGNTISHDDGHLHHIVMLDTSRPDPLCSLLPFNRFAASGMEKTPLSFPAPYVYEVGATDQWSALWHVMNMAPTARTYYIEYEIDYVTDLTGRRPVTSYYYDVDNCWGDSEFNVPGTGGPGSIFTKSINYTAPRDGTRVATGGHFHDGGIDVALKHGATTVCTATPTYVAGMLHSISACAGEVPVFAGQNLNVTVRYENDAPIPAAMGIMVSYVWEP